MKKTNLAVALLSAIGLSAVAAPAMAYEAGDILVRGRVINVNPDENSGLIHSGSTALAGTGVTVDSDTVPELDLTYMITKNWGTELILGYSKHEVTAFGTALTNPKVIKANALPPTLTLQYHFMPDSSIRPYIGAGLNYTLFFNEKTAGDLKAGGVKVKMDSSWGLAAQAGIDIALNDDWFINADVKYIQMDTKAKFSNGLWVDVDVDPFVYGIGIGRRF